MALLRWRVLGGSLAEQVHSGREQSGAGQRPVLSRYARSTTPAEPSEEANEARQEPKEATPGPAAEADVPSLADARVIADDASVEPEPPAEAQAAPSEPEPTPEPVEARDADPVPETSEVAPPEAETLNGRTVTDPAAKPAEPPTGPRAETLASAVEEAPAADLAEPDPAEETQAPAAASAPAADHEPVRRVEATEVHEPEQPAASAWSRSMVAVGERAEPEAGRGKKVPFWKRIALPRSPSASPGPAPAQPSVEPLVARLVALEKQLAANQSATETRLDKFEENITRLWELEEQLAVTEVRERLALLEANQQEIADGLHTVGRNLTLVAIVLAAGVAAGLLALGLLV